MKYSETKEGLIINSVANNLKTHYNNFLKASDRLEELLKPEFGEYILDAVYDLIEDVDAPLNYDVIKKKVDSYAKKHQIGKK